MMRRAEQNLRTLWSDVRYQNRFGDCKGREADKKGRQKSTNANRSELDNPLLLG